MNFEYQSQSNGNRALGPTQQRSGIDFKAVYQVLIISRLRQHRNKKNGTSKKKK